MANNPKFRPSLPDIEKSEEIDFERGKAAEGSSFESKAKFVELMQKCWQHDPSSRPKFEAIVDEFVGFQKAKRRASKKGSIN